MIFWINFSTVKGVFGVDPLELEKSEDNGN